MLRRAVALILFASSLAWPQGAAPPPGCANLPPRTVRPAPDDTPEQKEKEKKGLKQRVKDQFSSGCANVLLSGCWGDKGEKPPANTPDPPPSKDKAQTQTQTQTQTQAPSSDQTAPASAPDSAPQRPDLSFPEDQSRQAQQAAHGGVSSSKKTPGLDFPEEQSRRAEDAAHAGESSSRQKYNPPPSAASGDSDVTEMRPYDPHKAEKDVEVGDFYYKRGNFKGAVARYQEALELGPPSPSATFKLADAYEKDKKLDQAAVYYSEYVRQFPKGLQVADARAALQRLAPVVHADAGQLKQVEIAHDLQAGESLLAQKNFPDAVQRFCDVAGLAPDNARAIFRLAQALQATGEFAAAYQNYQTYLKLEPDGPFASSAQREVRRLGPQVQQGRVTSPSAETRP